MGNAPVHGRAGGNQSIRPLPPRTSNIRGSQEEERSTPRPSSPRTELADSLSEQNSYDAGDEQKPSSLNQREPQTPRDPEKKTESQGKVLKNERAERKKRPAKKTEKIDSKKTETVSPRTSRVNLENVKLLKENLEIIPFALGTPHEMFLNDPENTIPFYPRLLFCQMSGYETTKFVKVNAYLSSGLLSGNVVVTAPDPASPIPKTLTLHFPLCEPEIFKAFQEEDRSGFLFAQKTQGSFISMLPFFKEMLQKKGIASKVIQFLPKEHPTRLEIYGLPIEKAVQIIEFVQNVAFFLRSFHVLGVPYEDSFQLMRAAKSVDEIRQFFNFFSNVPGLCVFGAFSEEKGLQMIFYCPDLTVSDSLLISLFGMVEFLTEKRIAPHFLQFLCETVFKQMKPKVENRSFNGVPIGHMIVYAQNKAKFYYSTEV